jgi:RimJ/RimL family protein N-acetyltransferase
MHRALETTGYTRIGQKHGSVYRRGTWLDVYVFEVRRPDWRTPWD